MLTKMTQPVCVKIQFFKHLDGIVVNEVRLISQQAEVKQIIGFVQQYFMQMIPVVDLLPVVIDVQESVNVQQRNQFVHLLISPVLCVGIIMSAADNDR